VLSRLPIESVCFERYAIAGLPTEADYFGGKGFVRLGLTTPAGPVELVDTHLQARYPSHSPTCYASHRTGQVVQLALGLRGVRAPVIALGDFNCSDEDPVYRILLGLTGLRDVAVALGRPEPTLLHSNPFASANRRSDHRIDLVLARDGWDRRVVPRSARRIFDETFLIDGELATYSDHAGVRAELEIEAGPGAPPSAPDAGILELARSLLDTGRAEAEGRRRLHWEWAGAGLAGATAVAVAERAAPRLTRRGLLHAGLQGAALLALASTGACSLLAEHFEPSEIRAFRDLSAGLASLAEARAQPPARGADSSARARRRRAA